MYRIIVIATNCVSIKHVGCSAHIHLITCTYFRNIILYVMCRYVYNLLPYEISLTYVHLSFVIRKGNKIKHFYCRHLAIVQSIIIYM